MRTGRIPMSHEEFDLLPFHPGWKNEYAHGEAWITPRHSVAIVHTSLTEGPVCVPSGCRLLPITPEDAPGLIRAFKSAFWRTDEYWHWKRGAFDEAAQSSIETYFAGKRGIPHQAACLAVPAKGRRIVLGAALVVRRPDTPVLDMLFVRPQYQHQGMATALVQSAVNALLADGEADLESGYVLANDPSAAWHRKFGFEELPSLQNVRLYLRQAQQELQRHTIIGHLSGAEQQHIVAESARWKAAVEDLERIAEEQGYEAVTPLLRLHRHLG